MSQHPAYGVMLDFMKKEPTAKTSFELMRTSRSKVLNNPSQELVFFPSGCLYQVSPLLAMAYSQDLIKPVAFAKATDLQKKMLGLFWGLHVFGCWRNTLSIYKIDDQVINNLLSSPLPPETPASLFKRLPEWSLYVDISNASPQPTLIQDNIEAKLLGFWASYDYRKTGDTKTPVLNLIVHTDAMDFGTYSRFYPITLPLTEGMSINELYDIDVKRIAEQCGANVFNIQRQLSADYTLMTHLLSCLLWLCADEPEIHDKEFPIKKDEIKSRLRHKKTGEFVPPSSPKVYHLGKQMGDKVRQYKKTIDEYEADVKAGVRPVSRKRPHLRKGHWHGYWYGSGDDKVYKTKFLPMVFVNG